MPLPWPLAPLRFAAAWLHAFGRPAARRECPVCDRPVSRFVALPEEFERNARRHGYAHFGRSETLNLAEYSCPHCGAADRERLAALYVDEVVHAPGFARGGRLVHFAPEPALAARLRRLGAFEIRTADLQGDDVDDRVDLTAMTGYPDQAFDAFICSHVLEHVSDDAAALGELRRILRPGGWGIVMVPLMTHLDDTVEDPAAVEAADRWRLFGQGDHVRLYAKRDFLARLASARLAVRQLGHEHFGSDTFRRCGITRQSILYVVSHD